MMAVVSRPTERGRVGPATELIGENRDRASAGGESRLSPLSVVARIAG